MPRNQFEREPAEGGREVIEHELARQDGRLPATADRPQAEMKDGNDVRYREAGALDGVSGERSGPGRRRHGLLALSAGVAALWLLFRLGRRSRHRML